VEANAMTTPTLEEKPHTWPVIPGLTYRQLDHWCRVGYLKVPGRGHGFRREWPDEEVRVATVMTRLVQAGLSPAVAHDVARQGGRLAQIAPGVWIAVFEGATDE
jgi:hypothetical protein